MDDLRELYEEIILEHNRNPRNYGRKPDGANRSAHGYNPLCGDEVQVHVRLDDDVVADVSFEGRGCAICTAFSRLRRRSCPRPVDGTECSASIIRGTASLGISRLLLHIRACDDGGLDRARHQLLDSVR